MKREVNETLALYLGKIGHYQNPDLDSEPDREELVTGYLRFVVAIAKRYAKDTDELLDLIQEGNIGLMRAADTWDKGSAFTHWASLNIRSQIRNYLHGTDALKPLGRHGEPKPECVNIENAQGADYKVPRVTHKPERDLGKLTQHVELTDLQREVLELRMAGKNSASIAQLKNVSRQYVEQTEKAAIKTLKRVLQ